MSGGERDMSEKLEREVVAEIERRISASVGSPEIAFDIMQALGVGVEEINLTSPYDAFRVILVERLANSLSEVDHNTLSGIAALAIDALGRCRSEFAAYAKRKEIELIGVKNQLKSAPENARDVVARSAAKRAARKRHDNDPKQVAKAKAFELWKDWESGKIKKIYSAQQFATEVMRRHPVLKNSKVIAGWVTQWKKEKRAGEIPVC